jgi:hypothetical protein
MKYLQFAQLVRSHGASHCVVGPCMNGHLFTSALGPEFFFFFTQLE